MIHDDRSNDVMPFRTRRLFQFKQARFIPHLATPLRHQDGIILRIIEVVIRVVTDTSIRADDLPS